ncbi:MAG: hypothetical protein RLZZ385_2561 [Pseudomonadota bacterium]|jgi:MSHA biogenesis protein MshJ
MNEALTRRLNKAVADIQARPLAEKAIVLGLLMVGLFMGYLTLISDPLVARRASLELDIGNVTRQIAAQQTAYAQKVAQSQEDPNRFANERLAAIRVEQERIDQDITRLAGGLVTPNNMTQILTAALQGQQDLELMQIQNLAVRPLGSGTGSVAADNLLEDDESVAELRQARVSGQVFEHGILLEFRGDYFSTLRYLKLLENLTGAFFWDTVELRQLQWPNASIRLQLHTLSTQAGFLGV